MPEIYTQGKPANKALTFSNKITPVRNKFEESKLWELNINHKNYPNMTGKF